MPSFDDIERQVYKAMISVTFLPRGRALRERREDDVAVAVHYFLKVQFAARRRASTARRRRRARLILFHYFAMPATSRN